MSRFSGIDEWKMSPYAQCEFINPPGGDAFFGLALADQLERAKREGFHITAHASGIVASAAVPVFMVAERCLAVPGTIFVVHETSI